MKLAASLFAAPVLAAPFLAALSLAPLALPSVATGGSVATATWTPIRGGVKPAGLSGLQLQDPGAGAELKPALEALGATDLQGLRLDPRVVDGIRNPALGSNLADRIDPGALKSLAGRDDIRVIEDTRILDDDHVRTEIWVPEKWHDQLEAVDAAGKTVKLEPLGERFAIDLTNGEPSFVSWSVKESLLTSAGATSPGVALLSTGAAADGSGAVCEYRLAISPLIDPLVWSDRHGAYATELAVGLRVGGDPNDCQALPNPVAVQFSTVGAGVEVQPSTIQLARAGVGNDARVALLCTGRSAEPKVKAESRFGQPTYSMRVEKALAKFDVRVSRPTLRGFGLDDTELTITALAEDGTVLPPDADLAVHVEVDPAGRLSATDVVIPEGQASATLMVRSEGVGDAAVTVSAPGVAESRVELGFTWPVQLLVFTALAGALGAFLRAQQQRAEPANESDPDAAPTPPAKPRRGIRSIVGASAGLFVVIAAALGLDALGAPPGIVGTEAGAVLLAGAAGFAGPDALAALFKAVLPGAHG